MNMSKVLPILVCGAYLTTAADQAVKGNAAMAWVWLCYALANIGLALANT